MEETPRFGTLGRLDYDPIEDRLLCHLCGHWYHSLASHAWRAHQLTAAEYRELAGLNHQTRLITPTLRERLREVTAPLIARLRAEGKLRNWGEDRDRWEEDKAIATEVLHGGLRPEHARHSRERWTEEDRQKRAEQTRQRNLSGELRASPTAISKGIKRHYQEHPKYAEANAERLRALAHVYKVTEKEARDATCPHCGRVFRAASHRDKYCSPCRPEVKREYHREWARAKRREARVTNAVGE